MLSQSGLRDRHVSRRTLAVSRTRAIRARPAAGRNTAAARSVNRSVFKSKTYKGGSSLFSVKDPFPKIYRTQMYYTETITKTAGALGIFGTEAAYRANSTFAPQIAGGGVSHQPYGRDQLALLYLRYKVSGVRLQIQFSNPSEDGMIVGVKYNTPLDLLSLGGLSPAVQGEKFNVWMKALNNTGSQTVNYDRYFRMEDLMGVTKLQFKADIDEYSALTGASPVDTPSLRIAVGDITGTGGGTVNCIIKLTFYTNWFSRLTLGQS